MGEVKIPKGQPPLAPILAAIKAGTLSGEAAIEALGNRVYVTPQRILDQEGRDPFYESEQENYDEPDTYDAMKHAYLRGDIPKEVYDAANERLDEKFPDKPLDPEDVDEDIDDDVFTASGNWCEGMRKLRNKISGAVWDAVEAEGIAAAKEGRPEKDVRDAAKRHFTALFEPDRDELNRQYAAAKDRAKQHKG